MKDKTEFDLENYLSDNKYRYDILKEYYNLLYTYARSKYSDLGNEEISDIVQESLISFDASLRNGNFKGNSTPFTYLLGISRMRYLKALQKKKVSIDISEKALESDFQIEVDSADKNLLEIEESENSRKLHELMNKAIDEALTEKSRQLLRYYYLNYSTEEIANLLNMESPNSVKKMLYRARKQLREYFEKHPQLMEKIELWKS
ncbi:MAG: sigma-70 family RNA polymerase sigma factor [Bacteroidetes bacterium]|nr:sigma-70 family RNA polymerase sigma factor [Bacteroidota bacterium]